MKYRIFCCKGIIMLILGIGFYWGIPRILSEVEGIIWVLIGLSGLVASVLSACYGGSMVLAFILFHLFAPDGKRLANKEVSRIQSTQPTGPFDPWIQAPKIQVKKEEEKPIPKIWKKKVLAGG